MSTIQKEYVYILAKNYNVARMFAKTKGIYNFRYVSRQEHIEGLNAGTFIKVKGYSENPNYGKIQQILDVMKICYPKQVKISFDSF